MQNEIVSRSQWREARAALLVAEKEHTQSRARLAEARRALPWVKVDKQYTFVGRHGEISLAELFGNFSQLAIYHLMFGPGWGEPCEGCTQWANAMSGTTDYFVKADARLIAVSRAPYSEIVEQQAQLKWKFDWYSSLGSDFNYDYYVSSEQDQGPSQKVIEGAQGEQVEFDRGENHGVSVFYKNEEGEVFHTYSSYNRGIEELNGAFGYFDMLPKGRPW